jgi:hypothetical protein
LRQFLTRNGHPHQRLDETERWCFACLSHYPHERLDG